MAAFKMGKVVLRSLFKKPATLMYPVVPREFTPVTKGHIEIDIDNCIFCNLCAKKCPTNAIKVDRNARTWSIERMDCIQCGCCTWSCKKECLTMRPEYTAPNTVKVTDTFQGPPKEEKPKKEEASKESAAAV